MTQRFKSHLYSNRGDIYIQMLICMAVFLFILAFIFQVATVMTQKVWLDNRLNDVTKLIAIEGGTKSDRVKEAEDDITTKMGGIVTYDCEYLDETTGKVQLGTIVKIHYENEEFPIISIGDFHLNIVIALDRQAIGEVYYKE